MSKEHTKNTYSLVPGVYFDLLFKLDHRLKHPIIEILKITGIFVTCNKNLPLFDLG